MVRQSKAPVRIPNTRKTALVSKYRKYKGYWYRRTGRTATINRLSRDNKFYRVKVPVYTIYGPISKDQVVKTRYPLTSVEDVKECIDQMTALPFF